MNLNDALNQIIDEGIEAARADYTQPRQKLKLDGAIKGFEDCRGKEPYELPVLLVEANDRAYKAMRDEEPVEQYWYWRCRAAEIEWVANVMSNILVAQGLPPIISMMTVRGAMKAAEIIGVADR